MAFPVAPAPPRIPNLTPASARDEAVEFNEATGFFHYLHMPRVLFGQAFTWRQVVFGLLFIFCLMP